MKKLKRGIIVSIQSKSSETTLELARDIQNAGAVAFRADKPIPLDLPVIGLQKRKVADCSREAYITDTVEEVEKVRQWADYVAIDYRFFNPNLKKISKHCKKYNIPVIADIQRWDDWINIKEHNLYFTYIATTFSLFNRGNHANTRLVKDLSREVPGKVIAEGGYKNTTLVKKAYENGAYAICIGMAITDVYKLTKRFVNIDPGAKVR